MSQTVLKPSSWQSGGAPWHVSNPARLLVEKRAMAQKFPDFQLQRDNDQLVWVGSLTTNRNNSYQIAVYYPDTFPNLPPKIYPINPAITAWQNRATGELQHQYNDGSLCLFHPNDRSFERNTTAAALVIITAAWFFAYETWQETGEWPGIPGH